MTSPNTQTFERIRTYLIPKKKTTKGKRILRAVIGLGTASILLVNCRKADELVKNDPTPLHGPCTTTLDVETEVFENLDIMAQSIAYVDFHSSKSDYRDQLDAIAVSVDDPKVFFDHAQAALPSWNVIQPGSTPPINRTSFSQAMERQCPKKCVSWDFV